MSNSLSDTMDLQRRLRAAVARQADPTGRGFIPLDRLDAIITKPAIQTELRRVLGPSGDALVDQIVGANQKVKIFAILVLTDSVAKITDFVRTNAGDEVLPVAVDDALQVFAKDGLLSDAFKDWERELVQAFEHQQWVVLAPVFGSQGPFLNLSSKAILPFIDEPSSPSRHRVGGYSSIIPVKIHPSHLRDESTGSHIYAIKRFTATHKDTFQRELAAFKRFTTGTPHPNIVEFISAWHQDGQFNLILPWASSDLSTWWRNNPSPGAGPKATAWLANQAAGIASGLSAIHSLLGIGAADGRGQHGDIKPQNILFFPDPKDPNAPGIWKISDFGTSGVDSTDPEDKKLGCTPAYRAPEYDVPGRTIGKAYDLWSLGCVLLECLTWSLHGLKGLQEFETQRFTPIESAKAEDGAFWEKRSDESEVKRCVSQWMSGLEENGQKQSATVNSYVGDFLDLIGNEMMVVNETKRSSSEEIASKLKDLYEKLSVASPASEDIIVNLAVDDEFIPSPVTHAMPVNQAMPDNQVDWLGSMDGDMSDLLKDVYNGVGVPSLDNPWNPEAFEAPVNQDPFHHNPFSTNPFNASPVDADPFDTALYNTAQYNTVPDLFAYPTRTSEPSPPRNEQTFVEPPAPRYFTEPAPPSNQDDRSTACKRRRVEGKPASPKNQPCKTANSKSGKTPGAASPQNQGTLRFSCPFHKYDPKTFGIHDPRWRTCVGPGWTTIHRVKEHIDRKHSVQPNSCSRCLTAFPNLLKLNEHQRSKTPCVPDASREHQHRVTEAQRSLMRKRPRGRTEVEAWNDIYRIIFGLRDTDPVPSPYCDSAPVEAADTPASTTQSTTSSLDQFEEYLSQMASSADDDTMSKIQGYFDLARRFRQATTTQSSLPSLVDDRNTTTQASGWSCDNLTVEPSQLFEPPLFEPSMKGATDRPVCLSKEEEELSQILFEGFDDSQGMMLDGL